MGFWRTQAWEADSEIALRDYTEEVGEEPGYIGIFATKSRQSELQEITVLIEENQISQVKDLSTFVFLAKYKSQGLIEIIPLMCASANWSQYPAFSHPEAPCGALSGWLKQL